MIGLFNDDCLKVMAAIPSGSIDAVITDPPYGTTACKWDTVIPFAPMWEQLKRIIKPNGAIVLFGSQPFTSALIMSNPKMFKYCWIWDKIKPSGFQVAKYKPMMQHEDICIFGDGRLNYFPIKTARDKIKIGGPVSDSLSCPIARHDFKKRSYTDKHPKSILTFSNANQHNRFHPTQKPVALMEYLIKTYTNEGEIVLDFTMGSGTTGVACINTNRNFIGIEKDDKYFEIAKSRIEKA